MSSKGLENLHVAIIMDGNGRWAKKHAMPRILGHKAGGTALKNIITYAAKNHLKVLSIFAFSIENWLRPQEEVTFLMQLLDEYIANEWSSITGNNIKFLVSGNIDLLPEKTKVSLMKLIDDTKNNTGLILNMALSYSGQDELLECIKKISHKVASNAISINDITKQTVVDNLYNSELPEVDLLIRTSGEKRISNFMLWRLSYTELYFTDVLWPDFDEEEFNKAIEDYYRRIRRFGKTDEQLKG